MRTPVVAVETFGLGKRYRRTWGLQDCSFRLPLGRVTALVGPNGAGKSTLLRMLAGISTPSTGEVSVLGQSPRTQNVDLLKRIAYLDQERPLYKGFRVSEMLRFGQELNPRWDKAEQTVTSTSSIFRQIPGLASFQEGNRPRLPSRCALPSDPSCCC